MPLLLLPLLVTGLVLLWALLLPLLLVQRYRLGKARRRQYHWVAATNAWMSLPSALLFLLGTWAAERWIAGALAWAAGGLAVGLALGVLGLWTSRFERVADAVYLTPNAGLVLGLTLVVALRLAIGLWQGWVWWQDGVRPGAGIGSPASALGAGGLLLGYYLSMAWGIRSRLRRFARV